MTNQIVLQRLLTPAFVGASGHSPRAQFCHAAHAVLNRPCFHPTVTRTAFVVSLPRMSITFTIIVYTPASA